MNHKLNSGQRKRGYDPDGLVQQVPARVKLSPAVRLFCEEYLLYADAKQAALAAGFPAPHGYVLLRHQGVVDHITALQNRRASRLDFSAEHVLRAWLSAWRVDYNEFVELRIGSCRYCWGIGHHFQFVDLDEARRYAALHAESQKGIKRPEDRAPFDDEGGEGFDPYKTPMRGPSWYNADVEVGRLTLEEAGRLANSNHNCPRCFGKGEKNVILKDTRYLSPGARYLYEGIEIGDRGQIKFKLMPREVATQNIAKHLGMFPREGRGGGLKNLDEMNENELDAFLAANGITVDNVEFEQRDDGGGEGGSDSPGDPAQEELSEEAQAEGMGPLSELGK